MIRLTMAWVILCIILFSDTQALWFEKVNTASADECWRKLYETRDIIERCYYQQSSSMTRNDTDHSYIMDSIMNEDGSLNFESSDTIYFTAFCGVRMHFRPIQLCLIDTISNMEWAEAHGCSAEGIEAILTGLDVSLMNWDLYIPLCEQFYHCSAEPVNECRYELYRANLTHQIGALETICLIIPNYDSTVLSIKNTYYAKKKMNFRQCIEQKTLHCLPVVYRTAHELLESIALTYRAFVEDMDEIRDGCNKLMTDNCMRDYPNAMNIVNQRADQCLEPLYDLFMSSVANRTLIMHLASWRYNQLPPGAAAKMCSKIHAIQDCLSGYLTTADVSELSEQCGRTFNSLVHSVLGRLFTACTHFLELNPKPDDTTPQGTRNSARPSTVPRDPPTIPDVIPEAANTGILSKTNPEPITVNLETEASTNKAQASAPSSQTGGQTNLQVPVTVSMPVTAPMPVNVTQHISILMRTSEASVGKTKSTERVEDKFESLKTDEDNSAPPSASYYLHLLIVTLSLLHAIL